MLTLFSTLMSFLSGGLPRLLDFFQDKSDKKHELEMAQMQIERELQLKKAKLDQDTDSPQQATGTGHVLDRNELLARLTQRGETKKPE